LTRPGEGRRIPPMIVTMVSVKVKPGMEDSFIRATVKNH